MSKHSPIPDPASTLRTYTSRYDAGILLVCRKCERKLKHTGDTHLRSLKKSLRKLAKRSGTEPIHVIPVACLKLCPKGAVTVCTQADLAHTPPSLTLIRTREDLATLHRQSTLFPTLPVPTSPDPAPTSPS